MGSYDDGDWRDVRHTREAIRARAALVFYTVLVALPFVVLVAVGGFLCGLKPHEVTGVSCYNAMVTTLFFFDILRNAAHACFEEARERRLVKYRDGIPVVDPAYPHRRLAALAFAVGGRDPREWEM